MKVAVYRKERFNAAHRLHNPNWSDEKNKEIFDKCNNKNFHGHNYTLIVKVIGDIDPETGYVIDIKKLKKIIHEEIIQSFDHKNLNLDTVEFAALNPTAENIAMVIYNKLKPKLNSNLDLWVKLFETDKNYVKYPAY